jgi:hypothetical protein
MVGRIDCETKLCSFLPFVLDGIQKKTGSVDLGEPAMRGAPDAAALRKMFNSLVFKIKQTFLFVIPLLM